MGRFGRRGCHEGSKHEAVGGTQVLLTPVTLCMLRYVIGLNNISL